jgi:hypothetical protein
MLNINITPSLPFELSHFDLETKNLCKSDNYKGTEGVHFNHTSMQKENKKISIYV